MEWSFHDILSLVKTHHYTLKIESTQIYAFFFFNIKATREPKPDTLYFHTHVEICSLYTKSTVEYQPS